MQTGSPGLLLGLLILYNIAMCGQVLFGIVAEISSTILYSISDRYSRIIDHCDAFLTLLRPRVYDPCEVAIHKMSV